MGSCLRLRSAIDIYSSIYDINSTAYTQDNQGMRKIDPKQYKRHFTVRDLLDSKGGEQLRKDFTLEFAKRIKEIRKSKSLTQEQVAYLAGLDDAYYGHLEIGRYRATLFTAWKIAKALDVSLDELVNF